MEIERREAVHWFSEIEGPRNSKHPVHAAPSGEVPPDTPLERHATCDCVNEATPNAVVPPDTPLERHATCDCVNEATLNAVVPPDTPLERHATL